MDVRAMIQRRTARPGARPAPVTKALVALVAGAAAFQLAAARPAAASSRTGSTDAAARAALAAPAVIDWSSKLERIG